VTLNRGALIECAEKKWKKSRKLHHHAAISNLTGQSFTRVMSSLSHSLVVSTPPASCQLCSFFCSSKSLIFLSENFITPQACCLALLTTIAFNKKKKKKSLSYVKIVHKTWCKLSRLAFNDLFSSLFIRYSLRIVSSLSTRIVSEIDDFYFLSIVTSRIGKAQELLRDV
jgi:hypothetical protein